MEEVLKDYKKKPKPSNRLVKGESQLAQCEKYMKAEEQREKDMIMVRVDKNTIILCERSDKKRIIEKYNNLEREKYLSHNFQTLKSK